MRHILTSLIVAGGLIALAGNVAQAQSPAHNYRFCSESTQSMTGWSCRYDTWQQCEETIVGVGGFCRENPAIETPQAPNHGAAHHSVY